MCFFEIDQTTLVAGGWLDDDSDVCAKLIYLERVTLRLRSLPVDCGLLLEILVNLVELFALDPKLEVLRHGIILDDAWHAFDLERLL